MGRPKKQVEQVTVTLTAKVVGRNKIAIPPAEVFKLAAIGCKDIEICNFFGIDENTLTYNFDIELMTGRESMKQTLRRKQLEVAMTGNPTMLIWLGKNLLGQTDVPINTEDNKILPWENTIGVVNEST
jgi:hypothetical protein